MYYECHITLAKQECVSPRQTIEELDWKYSAIDGDPDLGEGLLEYATTHCPGRADLATVIEDMHDMAKQLNSLGHRVIRQKVEMVIYDSRLDKTGE